MDLDLDPLMAAGSDLTSLEFASLRNWELGGTAALQGFGLGLGDSDLGSASGLWLSPPSERDPLRLSACSDVPDTWAPHMQVHLSVVQLQPAELQRIPFLLPLPVVGGRFP